MNFGGEYSADGLQFGQAARGRRSGIPGWPSAPYPSRARGGVAAEDAHRSERQTGSRRVRRSRPGNVGVEGRVSDRPTDWRMPPWHPRQRTPGRKPGPESLTEPNSEFSRQKIANSVQPWSELAILRSPKAKTHDYLRYRKAPTQTTDKKVHFPLPRPRKTVCFDRQRPKPTVFRIAHPMPNKQHFRHRSR